MYIPLFSGKEKTVLKEDVCEFLEPVRKISGVGVDVLST
jgi:hypothetical protein